MRKLLLLALMATSAHAGFKNLTIHSRANCLRINESIAWDATQYHEIKVTSTHKYCGGGKCYNIHRLDTNGFENSWRIAAVHFNEHAPGAYTYVVNAWFYIKENGIERKLGETYAINCDIYDGWWDSDHPERRS